MAYNWEEFFLEKSFRIDLAIYYTGNLYKKKWIPSFF